jgi:hypothetical protein
MTLATKERMPLAMRFAVEPRYSVEEMTQSITASYDPHSQTSASLHCMSRSWCTSQTSTGNQITGQDADQYEDD